MADDKTFPNAVVVAKDIDSHNPAIDTYFLEQIGTFTLGADTGVSGKTAASLVYEIEAVAGHTLVTGSEISLLDPAGDRQFYAVVVTAGATTIALDRPIDHIFPVTGGIAQIVNSHMNVDGSTVPRIFTIRGGAHAANFRRYILTIIDAGAMDDGLFGVLPKLTRGLVLRIVNSYQKTIFCFKTNGDIKQFAFDGEYTPAAQGPSGQESFAARLTFAGKEKHGVVHKIADEDVIQIVVQDVLTGLGDLRVSAMGNDTEGEE